jgi:hypothetical protein
MRRDVRMKSPGMSVLDRIDYWSRRERGRERGADERERAR